MSVIFFASIFIYKEKPVIAQREDLCMLSRKWSFILCPWNVGDGLSLADSGAVPSTPSYPTKSHMSVDIYCDLFLHVLGTPFRLGFSPAVSLARCDTSRISLFLGSRTFLCCTLSAAISSRDMQSPSLILVLEGVWLLYLRWEFCPLMRWYYLNASKSEVWKFSRPPRHHHSHFLPCFLSCLPPPDRYPCQ